MPDLKYSGLCELKYLNFHSSIVIFMGDTGASIWRFWRLPLKCPRLQLMNRCLQRPKNHAGVFRVQDNLIHQISTKTVRGGCTPFLRTGGILQETSKKMRIYAVPLRFWSLAVHGVFLCSEIRCASFGSVEPTVYELQPRAFLGDSRTTLNFGAPYTVQEIKTLYELPYETLTKYVQFYKCMPPQCGLRHPMWLALFRHVTWEKCLWRHWGHS